MTTELQNKVWSILPKEVKEEVKEIYSNAIIYHPCGYNHKTDLLKYLFGIHNLTSDAEGEEMLMASRKQVQKLYREYCAECDNEVEGSANRLSLGGRLAVLTDLFGSKCLPDKEPKSCEELLDEMNGIVDKMLDATEPKPSEPKYKVGDMVSVKTENCETEIAKVVYYDANDDSYRIEFMRDDAEGSLWLTESDLEPYTEPEEEVSKMKPIESKVRVYLVTKEEDEEFRQLLHKNGFKWNTGESLIDNSVWSFDKEESKIHNIYPNKIVTYSGDITLNILPFSKFKKQYFEEKSHNLSQEIANCDKHFDNILRDGFSKERRLNIAKDFASVLLSRLNYDPFTAQINCCCSGGAAVNPYLNIARIALSVADALIAESEKGGEK